MGDAGPSLNLTPRASSKKNAAAGWVFEHRKPAIVNGTDSESRFYSGLDDMTGFRTRNMICMPIIDDSGKCLGTIQSLNKKSGDFTTDDLELLDVTARLVVVAQNKNKCYDEILTTNITCGKFELDCLLSWRSLPEAAN